MLRRRRILPYERSPNKRLFRLMRTMTIRLRRNITQERDAHTEKSQPLRVMLRRRRILPYERSPNKRLFRLMRTMTIRLRRNITQERDDHTEKITASPCDVSPQANFATETLAEQTLLLPG